MKFLINFCKLRIGKTKRRAQRAQDTGVKLIAHPQRDVVNPSGHLQPTRSYLPTQLLDSGQLQKSCASCPQLRFSPH